MSFVYTHHTVFAEFPMTFEFLEVMQTEEFKELLERASEGAFYKKESKSLYCVMWTFTDGELASRAETRLNAVIDYFNKKIEMNG